jgi:hypothetical protein
MKTAAGNIFVSETAMNVTIEAIAIVKENIGHSDIIIGVEWPQDEGVIDGMSPLVSTITRGGDAGVRVWKANQSDRSIKRVSA